MHKKMGFTLIELVVVIVILGVLSVVAAPRFLNLQTDARNATLEGVKSQLQTMLDLSYAKFAIAGVEQKKLVNGKEVPIDGCENCQFRFGYPTSHAGNFTSLMTGVGEGEKIVMAYLDSGSHKPYALFTFADNVKEEDFGGTNYSFIKHPSCYVLYEPLGIKIDADSGEVGIESDYKITLVPCL